MHADQTRSSHPPGPGADARLPAAQRVRRGHGRDLAAERRPGLHDALPIYEPGARLLEYEDFDVCTLLLSEVPADTIRAKVDDLLAPIRGNPGLYEALVEYFARDMDVTATAEAMHVHPNTLRYRLARIEKLLGRSLRQSTTIADLCLALLATPR